LDWSAKLKRALVDIANAALRPLGIQIYKAGLDMESVLRLLSRQAGRIGSVIDIGASTGRWSNMAMKYFPQTRFVGVDPLSEREGDLKRLKARKPLFDYVLGVAGEIDEGTVQLAVTGDLDGSTVGGKADDMRTVPSYSVDRIVEMKKCVGPYILKFDTHGFEVPILKGATKTLTKTEYIVMEVYNFKHTDGTLLFHEMCALLETKGFRCLQLVDPMQRPFDRTLWQMDIIFARSENVAFSENSYYRTGPA
jgi:FkbM family methyltransferase